MIIKSEKLKVSASAIKTYTQCPRKYYYTYINKLPKKKWAHIELGNFVHDALETFHNRMRDDPLPESGWAQALKEACFAEAPKYALTKEQRATAFGMLQTYLQKLKENGFPKVLFNEKEFTIELPENVVLRGFIDRVDDIGDMFEIVDYKGLALDTPIPTPSGWSTMGDLSVGDFVLGRDGRPTRVTNKSKIHNRPCYNIEFSDHTAVVCDNVHLWKVGFRESGSTDNYDDVIDADELYRRFHSATSGIFIIENSEHLVLPDADLPLDPWLLGAWLGDGSSRRGQITVGGHDLKDMTELLGKSWGPLSVREEKTAYAVTCVKRHAELCGYGHAEFTIYNNQRYCVQCQNGNSADSTRWNIPLSGVLRKLNLLNNKHIPPQYLRASHSQRLELLRGLMDSDGSWNPHRKRAVFVTTSDDLMRDVRELIRTFGITAHHFYAKDKLGNTSHRIEFRPVHINPFKLPRKATQVDSFLETSFKHDYAARRRKITKIYPVDSVPTQCIAVDANDSLYLCGSGLIVTHNTGKSKHLDEFQLLVYALALWHEHPEIKRVKGSYIVLGEGSKVIPYTISKTDTDRCVTEILKVANMIRTDQSWEPRPTRLCSYCDFESACPATKSDTNEWGSAPGASNG
jgi:CRISPR/Cas system-associated exonuclease Cas4 (RecB family)